MAKTRKSRQRPDFAPVREMMLNTIPAGIGHGTVCTPEDPAEDHFRFEGESDVYVEVRLEPSGQRLSARLGGIAGGPGSGVWMIPPVDTEVRVLFEDGADPTIVGVLSGAELPTLLVDYGAAALVIQRKLGDVRIKATGVDHGEAGIAGGSIYIDAVLGDVIVNGGAAKVARVGDTVTIDRDTIIAACEGAFVPLIPSAPVGADATGTITTGGERFKA